jgi:cell division protein FtsI/penicillin-binding protein 2
VPVALIVGRLYMVQIENGKSYAERAERQYVRPSTKVLDRGNIYFATKDGSNYSAAVLKSGFLLVANATKIKDAEATYTAINKLMPLDKAEYTAHIKKNDTYEELAKHVDEEVGKKIQALALPGITLVREKWRVYPGEQLASHALGFVGFKGDELVGRYGLERFYEQTLQRQSSSLYVNFFAEIFSNASNAVSSDKPAEGDIVSWIEPSVQTYLEQQIDEVHKDWKTDLTAGIIMDPKTGAILAMAATPDFDPNTYNTEKDISRFSNPLVENIYEMGSIIKPLTMAAGIDAGAVNASTTYNDKGSLTLDGFTIYNFDKKARGSNGNAL